jgi:hypothetical protein
VTAAAAPTATSLLALVLALACAFTATAYALPDERAYELVSPANKSSSGGVFPSGELTNLVEQFGRPLQSSNSGNAIAYEGEPFFEPQLGSLNEYFSALTGTGWQTENLTPGVRSTSENPNQANEHRGFSPDLSVGVISSKAAISGDPAVPPRYVNLYIADGPGLRRLRAVIRFTPPNRTPYFRFGWAHKHGGSSEVLLLHYLLFAGGNAGTAGVPAFSHVLFAANDALTANATDPGELANNLYEWDQGQLRLVNVLPDGTTTLNGTFGVDHNDEYLSGMWPNLSNVISADGSKIFWTDQNTGNLYVREHGERTRQVDAAIGGGGEYQAASADGSRVLFTKAGHLYAFDLATDATTDIAGGVEGILGSSSDGASVYLVSSAALAAEATLGQPNLYLARAGTLTFIATLSEADNNVQTPELTRVGPIGDWYRTFTGRTARVSPNGRYVVFMSINTLTGYDNTDAVRNGKDYEVFVYDSAAGVLACASCNADGSRPTESTLLPIPANGTYQQRYLNDNGQLFFSTPDAVLPQDTNHVSDLYEYRNGHVYLLSPGTTEDPAIFADASESGNDVFFTTPQPLMPADHDRIIDLYDARVGGHAEQPPAAPCSGEGCLTPPAPPPTAQGLASAVFVGAGNLPPPVSSAVVVKTRTDTHRLANALKACRAKHDRHKRAVCERRARARYGPRSGPARRGR